MGPQILIYFYVALIFQFTPAFCLHNLYGTSGLYNNPSSRSSRYSGSGNDVKYGNGIGSFISNGNINFDDTAPSADKWPKGKGIFDVGSGSTVVTGDNGSYVINHGPFSGSRNYNKNVNGRSGKSSWDPDLFQMKQDRKMAEKNEKMERKRLEQQQKQADKEAEQERKRLEREQKQKVKEAEQERKRLEQEQSHAAKMALHDQKMALHALKMKEHDRKMHIHSLKMAGPKDCTEIPNFDDESLYPSPQSNHIGIGSRMRYYNVKYQTYRCRDPPRYPEFYKLVTHYSGRADDGSISIGSNNIWKYIFDDGEQFDWIPDEAEEKTENEIVQEKPKRRRSRSHGQGHRSSQGHSHGTSGRRKRRTSTTFN